MSDQDALIRSLRELPRYRMVFWGPENRIDIEVVRWSDVEAAVLDRPAPPMKVCECGLENMQANRATFGGQHDTDCPARPAPEPDPQRLCIATTRIHGEARICALPEGHASAHLTADRMVYWTDPPA